MEYGEVQKAEFIERSSRFTARVRSAGAEVKAHIKNTGRCRELLVPGAEVWLVPAADPRRQTRWDLVTVRRGGQLVNIDSQAPNAVVREWLQAGGLFSQLTKLQPEYQYDRSRLDFYAEADGQRVLIEVKGVTLAAGATAMFPDAPSARAVRHVRELIRAARSGYQTYLLFVIQMKGVAVLTPNTALQPEFTAALQDAHRAGVRLLAFDCRVTPNGLALDRPVPVVLAAPQLPQITEPLLTWYRANRRDLPWRRDPSPYHVWISEIMLQQTRVEAVKEYYARFLARLPDIPALAAAGEDELLKLWEGLGYYNRVRNLQKAAATIMQQYDGRFPERYEDILALDGIGSYTAGAISAIALGNPRPAVDGNVLRVVSRLLALTTDIAKESTKKAVAEQLTAVIPAAAPGDFDQGLIELGALVCVPNGVPKCAQCPLQHLCLAHQQGREQDFPVKSGKKPRRVEERTVLIIKDGARVAIAKRPERGLLAGLYELPNVPGHLDQAAVDHWLREQGLKPLFIKEIRAAKHIFSHIEWQMIGYQVRVDELSRYAGSDLLFVTPAQIKKDYSIPSAFKAYIKEVME